MNIENDKQFARNMLLFLSYFFLFTFLLVYRFGINNFTVIMIAMDVVIGLPMFLICISGSEEYEDDQEDASERLKKTRLKAIEYLKREGKWL